jgi:hypothetical protein
MPNKCDPGKTSSGKKYFYCCVERVHTVVKNINLGEDQVENRGKIIGKRGNDTVKNPPNWRARYVILAQHVEQKPTHVSHPRFLTFKRMPRNIATSTARRKMPKRNKEKTNINVEFFRITTIE